jgi:hypothetical protein
MTTGAWLGGIGGLAGAALGLTGGWMGMYFSIRNTETPAERRYMTAMGAVFYGVLWLFLGALLLAMANIEAYPLLAGAALMVLWGGYGLGLALFIRKANAWQRAIRAGEADSPLTSAVFLPSALAGLAGQVLLVYAAAGLSPAIAIGLACVLLAGDAATAGLARWGWRTPPDGDRPEP